MEKILFIKANPIDTENLRLDKEEKAIRNSLNLSRNTNQYQFEPRGAVTTDDLLQELLTIQPHVLHISGHADAESGLFLEDKDGYSEEVPILEFLELLANFEQINLLFLNSCHSLTEVEQFESSKLPFIIGMKDKIPDDTAIKFSKAFYTAFFNNRTVKDAFKIALGMISLRKFNDELIPKLVENGSSESVDPFDDSLAVPLVSDGEIEKAKEQIRKRIKNQKIKIGAFYSLAVIAIIFTGIINEDPNISTFAIVGSVPTALGSLPFAVIDKNKEKLDLIELFELKRMRFLRAINKITKQDIKDLNDEFKDILTK